jgi:SpoVK/Ycf46/Vps4 family AAA+-type ATPase
MQMEYLLYPYIISNLKDLSTGILYLDMIIIFMSTTLYLIYNNRKLSNFFGSKFNKYFSKVKSKIIFSNEGKDRSQNFKALMYYLERNNFDNIKELKERACYIWNKNDEYIENAKSSGYDINQIEKFNFTKDIFGRVIQEVKEKNRGRDNTEYKDVYILEIFSEKLELLELELWIKQQQKIYNKHIRDKCCKNQMILTINWDESDNDFEVNDAEWESSITFDNSYFHNKENIVKKIDFFLNNKDWYYERGIPYNLGILLYGEPGGGKTRFIKQLLNHTERHAIDIKLTDTFDFDELKNIIHNEKIIDEFIIPQEKRIIIFEDIDAVGDVLKDRDKKQEELESHIQTIKIQKKKKKDNISKDSKDSKNTKIQHKIIQESSNNLSNFLNIIDGLNECSGRIIIMTTNKIEFLDPAIIRPGRIDIKIEFKKCTSEDIFNMSKLFWKKQFTYNLTDMKEDINNKYTSAEVINIFRGGDNFDDIKSFFIK